MRLKGQKRRHVYKISVSFSQDRTFAVELIRLQQARKVVYHVKKVLVYNRTQFIGINWDSEPSEYSENLDIHFFFFFCK